MGILEFSKNFGTDEQCRNYVYKTRWPDGYRCPRCQHNEKWQVNKYKYKCKKCGYQATVISGTLFHNTHIRLDTWFKSIWYITWNKNKVSALELQKYLKLRNNRTSLRLLSKLRDAMVQHEKNRKLNGCVAFYRKPFYINIEGKEQSKKATIYSYALGNVSEKEFGWRKKIDWIRIGFSKNDSLEDISEFIKNNVQAGSTIVVSHGFFEKYSKVVDKDYLWEPITGWKSPRLKKLNLPNNYNEKSLNDAVTKYCENYNKKQRIEIGFYDLLNTAINGVNII